MLLKQHFKTTSLDADLLIELLPGFIQEINEEFRLLLENFNLSNLDRVEEIAHKLKGTAVCFGAFQLENASKQIEDNITKNENHLLMDTIELLRRYIKSIELDLSRTNKLNKTTH